MSSITAQTHATLDGVIDAPPADALLPYMSDAGRQGALDLALAADALLLPRETWQGLARAWRDQTGAMAERLNAMPKYVVSATLGSADEWDHTTIVGYEDIAGLRKRERLLTYGCGRLARVLEVSADRRSHRRQWRRRRARRPPAGARSRLRPALHPEAGVRLPGDPRTAAGRSVDDRSPGKLRTCWRAS